MIRLLPLVLAAGFVIGVPGVADAQRIDSPYRFVEHTQTLTLVGAHIDADPGAVGAGPRAAAAFGVRYGLRIGGPFNGEVELLTMPTTRMVVDTATVMGAYREVGEADATLLAALAALRFNLTGARTVYRLQPHVVFGGGVVFNISGSDELDEGVPQDARFRFGTSFAGQFGGGLEWFATNRVSVRADARSLLWRLRTPEAFRLGDRATELPDAEWKRNTFFGLGVGYHF